MPIATGVISTNFVPRFGMPAEQFNTLRTWYGMGYAVDGTKVAGTGAATGYFTNWYAPYQQSALAATDFSNVAGQYYGNVGNFPSSTYTATTPAASSTATYGIS